MDSNKSKLDIFPRYGHIISHIFSDFFMVKFGVNISNTLREINGNVVWMFIEKVSEKKWTPHYKISCQAHEKNEAFMMKPKSPKIRKKNLKQSDRAVVGIESFLCSGLYFLLMQNDDCCLLKSFICLAPT